VENAVSLAVWRKGFNQPNKVLVILELMPQQRSIILVWAIIELLFGAAWAISFFSASFHLYVVNIVYVLKKRAHE
jgi:hypothetical protein